LAASSHFILVVLKRNIMKQFTRTAISTWVFKFILLASYVSLFAFVIVIRGNVKFYQTIVFFTYLASTADPVLFFSTDYVMSLCPGASTSSKHINKWQAIRCSARHLPVLLVVMRNCYCLVDQLILWLYYGTGNIWLLLVYLFFDFMILLWKHYICIFFSWFLKSKLIDLSAIKLHNLRKTRILQIVCWKK